LKELGIIRKRLTLLLAIREIYDVKADIFAS